MKILQIYVKFEFLIIKNGNWRKIGWEKKDNRTEIRRILWQSRNKRPSRILRADQALGWEANRDPEFLGLQRAPRRRHGRFFGETIASFPSDLWGEHPIQVAPQELHLAPAIQARWFLKVSRHVQRNNSAAVRRWLPAQKYTWHFPWYPERSDQQKSQPQQLW